MCHTLKSLQVPYRSAVVAIANDDVLINGLIDGVVNPIMKPAMEFIPPEVKVTGGVLAGVACIAVLKSSTKTWNEVATNIYNKMANKLSTNNMNFEEYDSFQTNEIRIIINGEVSLVTPAEAEMCVTNKECAKLKTINSTNAWRLSVMTNLKVLFENFKDERVSDIEALWLLFNEICVQKPEISSFLRTFLGKAVVNAAILALLIPLVTATVGSGLLIPAFLTCVVGSSVALAAESINLLREYAGQVSKEKDNVFIDFVNEIVKPNKEGVKFNIYKVVDDLPKPTNINNKASAQSSAQASAQASDEYIITVNDVSHGTLQQLMKTRKKQDSYKKFVQFWRNCTNADIGAKLDVYSETLSLLQSRYSNKLTADKKKEAHENLKKELNDKHADNLRKIEGILSDEKIKHPANWSAGCDTMKDRSIQNSDQDGACVIL